MLPSKKFGKNLKGEIKAKKISLQFDNFFEKLKLKILISQIVQPYPDIFAKLPDFLGSMPD